MATYLEFKDSKTEKFWEVKTRGNAATTRWAKLGTDGQTKVKEMETPKEAKKYAAKQMASKIKKGYAEVKN